MAADYPGLNVIGFTQGIDTHESDLYGLTAIQHAEQPANCSSKPDKTVVFGRVGRLKLLTSCKC